MTDLIVSRQDSLVGNLKRLWACISPSRRRQLYAILCLMFVGAVSEMVTLGAIVPFLSLLANPEWAAAYPQWQSLLAKLGWSNPNHMLVAATAAFAVIALVTGGIRLLLLWQGQRFAHQLGHDLRVEAYRRVLFQSYLYHVSKNSSFLIAALNKVDHMVGLVMQLMQLSTAIVISTFVIVALLVISPVITLSAVVFGLVYVAISYLNRSKVVANGKVWANALGERIKSLQEGLGGIRDVLIDQAQETFVRRFARVDEIIRRVQIANTFIAAAPRFIIESIGMVFIALVALIVSRQPGGIVASLPMLGALVLGAQRLLPLLQMSYQGWTGVLGSNRSLADVLTLLELPIVLNLPLLEDQGRMPFRTEIELEKVNFQYEVHRPFMVKNVSLVIEKGARVGFVGKTGSGKSTIVDLIMGLLPPTSGEIKVDGLPLTSENLRLWQSQIAHVPQMIYLADASIAENIAFGTAANQIDLARVREAARQAELASFIETLPQKYDTIVGERGIRLSGGQRQRVGIARALYKQSRLLVFDEATSALDSETEAAIMVSIQALNKDLTILIVAHRLSTVEICDEIYSVDSGRVAKKGPRSIAVHQATSTG